MLHLRLITGSLLVALALGVVWADEALTSGGWRGLILALFAGLIVAPAAAYEVVGLARRRGIDARAWVALPAAGAIALAAWAFPDSPAPVLTVAVLAFFFALVAAIPGRNVEGGLASASGTLLAVVYIGGFLAFWLLLRHERSAWTLVGALLVTKSCDVGAYFTGSTVGGPKMIPWLSPKKTWAGLIGGVATASLAGLVFALATRGFDDATQHVPLWLGAVFGCCAGFIGQAGDLCASLFKRDARAKDSGAVLPGMGGVLDVIDSPLLVGPLAYWLLG